MLRSRKKERTRNTIIAEATIFFAEKPYDDVIVDEVAAAAFISRKTLYNYFKNKEELFFAVGNQVYKRENHLLEEILEQDITGKERILKICEKKFRDGSENPVLLNITQEFWERFSLGEISSDEEYQKLADRIGADKLNLLLEQTGVVDEHELEDYFDEPNYYELSIQLMKTAYIWIKAIQTGKEDGTIRTDLPDMHIMHFVNVTLDGLVLEMRRRKSAFDMVSLSNETFRTEIMDLISRFLDG